MSAAGCPFDVAWHGACGRPLVLERDYCDRHLGKQCVNCRRQATHECPYSGSIAVCGAMLCARCEHGDYGRHRERPGIAAEDRASTAETTRDL